MSAEAIQGIFYFAIFLWLFTIIFTIALAVSKGYSGFLAFLLGLFIPLLGSTIIIALLPNKKEMNKKYNDLGLEKKENTLPQIKCSCQNIITDYTSCPHCGIGIQDYKIKKDEENLAKRKKLFEEYEKKGISAIFTDEMIKEAKDLRRIYSKNVSVSYLNKTAKYLGFEIEINEDDLEILFNKPKKSIIDVPITHNGNEDLIRECLKCGNKEVKKTGETLVCSKCGSGLFS